MKTKQIKIVIDTNDADYLTKITPISEPDLNELRPLIQAIKQFKPYKGKKRGTYTSTHEHNFPYSSEYASERDFHPRIDLGEKTVYQLYPTIKKKTFDLFDNYLPFAEWGFHTIESIEILEIEVKEKLI